MTTDPPRWFVDDLLADPEFRRDLAGRPMDEWLDEVRGVWRAHLRITHLSAMTHSQVVAALDSDALWHLRDSAEEAEILRHHLPGKTVVMLQMMFGERWATSPGYADLRRRHHHAVAVAALRGRSSAVVPPQLAPVLPRHIPRHSMAVGDRAPEPADLPEPPIVTLTAALRARLRWYLRTGASDAGDLLHLSGACVVRAWAACQGNSYSYLRIQYRGEVVGCSNSDEDLDGWVDRLLALFPPTVGREGSPWH